LLSLITTLQKVGTAPAIEMTAYAAWLKGKQGNLETGG